VSRLCQFKLVVTGLILTSFVATAAGVGASTTTPQLDRLSASVADAAKGVALSSAAMKELAAISKNSKYYFGPATIGSGCYIYEKGQSGLPPNPLASCSYGDLKSTKLMVLTGDSQSAMWAPGFDVVGKALGYRVVLLGKSACSAWYTDVAWVDGSSFPACALWRKNVATYINTIHPLFVFPVGAVGVMAKGNASVHGGATTAEIKVGGTDFISAVAPSKSRIVIISNIPWLASWVTPTAPNQCLLFHSKTPSACNVAKSAAIDSQMFPALKEIATVNKLKFVDISQLSCTATTCVTAVGSHIVYLDGVHYQRDFVTYVATALQQLIQPALK